MRWPQISKVAVCTLTFSIAAMCTAVKVRAAETNSADVSPADVSPANKGCSLLRYGELPVTMVGTQPLISGTINGQSAKFIADSGAFFSLLSREAVDRFQLPTDPLPSNLHVYGVGGSAQAGVAKAQSFSLEGFGGGRAIHGVDFIVSGSSFGRDIAGLIGQNILGRVDVEYDLANGVIRIFKSKDCKGVRFAYWAGDLPVARMPIDKTTPVSPHIIGTAKINNKSIRVVFDTGAWRSILSLDAAARAGVKPEIGDVTAAGMTGGIGRRINESWLARFDSLDLGGEMIKNARLRISKLSLPGNADMLLGADFFLSHRIYVAMEQGALFFTYNGGPVFDLRDDDTDMKSSTSAAGAMGEMNAADYRRRGTASASRRNFDGALVDFDQAIKLDGSDPENFIERAKAHWQNRDMDLAMADLDQAIKLSPANTRALVLRGQLSLSLRQVDEARQDFDAALRSAPHESTLLLEIAGVYDRVGHYRDSIPYLDSWIAANPKHDSLWSAFNSRCWSRAMINTQLDLALADCNRAVKIAPRNSAVFDSRGIVQLRLGHFDEAIADYDKALKLQPKQPWAMYGRGMAKLRSGKKSEGTLDIANAMSLDSTVAGQFKAIGIEP